MRSWVSAGEPAFRPSRPLQRSRKTRPNPQGSAISFVSFTDQTELCLSMTMEHAYISSMRNEIKIKRKTRDFNPRTFLSTAGRGREMLSYEKKHIIFAQ